MMDSDYLTATSPTRALDTRAPRRAAAGLSPDLVKHRFETLIDAFGAEDRRNRGYLKYDKVLEIYGLFLHSAIGELRDSELSDFVQKHAYYAGQQADLVVDYQKLTEALRKRDNEMMAKAEQRSLRQTALGQQTGFGSPEKALSPLSPPKAGAPGGAFAGFGVKATLQNPGGPYDAASAQLAHSPTKGPSPGGGFGGGRPRALGGGLRPPPIEAMNAAAPAMPNTAYAPVPAQTGFGQLGGQNMQAILGGGGYGGPTSPIGGGGGGSGAGFGRRRTGESPVASYAGPPPGGGGGGMGGYVPQLPQMGYAAAPPPNSAAQQYQPPPAMQQIEQQMPPAGAGMGAANIGLAAAGSLMELLAACELADDENSGRLYATQVLTCCRMQGLEESSSLLRRMISDCCDEGVDGKCEYVRLVQQIAAHRAGHKAMASVEQLSGRPPPPGVRQ